MSACSRGMPASCGLPLSVLLSVLFDDVAAEVDADTQPAAVLRRLGLPDRVVVLVQLVDIAVAAIFNPTARLPFGEAVGLRLQPSIAGASGVRIGVGRSPDRGRRYSAKLDPRSSCSARRVSPSPHLPCRVVRPRRRRADLNP